MKFRKLRADEIEVKVKQVKETGCVCLLYKTARTDMDILDETVGPDNWQDGYEEIKGNMYCKIGIWNEKMGQWIWKQDCGIESREDGEGNEKKGEASDAFKRAGFKWGIGRELYTAPFIWIKSDVVPTQKVGQGWKLADAFAKFHVSKIEYSDKDEIITLVVKDSKGNTVYTFGKNTKDEIIKTVPPVIDKEIPAIEPDSVVVVKTTKKTPTPTADDWLPVNAFKGLAERTNTITELQTLLNGQRGNPHLQELAEIASARKAEIIAKMGA